MDGARSTRALVKLPMALCPGKSAVGCPLENLETGRFGSVLLNRTRRINQTDQTNQIDEKDQFAGVLSLLGRTAVV